MNRCVLHFGMPKTGSSSIQESLYHGLRSRGFRYVSLGAVNCEPVMTALFSTLPGDYHYYQKLGLHASRIDALVSRQRRAFEDRIERSRKRHETLILSSESCWACSADEYQRIRRYFNDRGYVVDVFVYLRPRKRWLESQLQERVKLGARAFDLLPDELRTQLDYPGRLDVLDEMFGRERVTAVPFVPDAFPDGCVVRDFCRRAGVPVEPGRIRRVNDGLSMEAFKLLLAQRRFAGGYGTGLRAVVRNEVLMRRLTEVAGPPVRVHSRLVGHMAEEWRRQTPAIERRLGTAFPEDDPTRDDHGPCFGDPADVTSFSPAALEWLSARTGLPRVRPTKGDGAARAVGEQMQHLLQHPSVGSRLRWLQMILARRIAHSLRGV
jgi:hypothetical protein